MNKQILLLLFTTILFSCSKNTSEKATTEESVPLLNVSYVGEYPHDTNAFTEGLLFHEGELFESTGATDLPQTRSLFGAVDLNTGAIDVKVELDREQYFGEGITFLNGRVYQLTYQSQKGFVYDDSTYEQIQEFKIPSAEGWGLTTDGTSIIMSDGTTQLTYLDPVSLAVTKKLTVKEQYFSKEKLNELEYVDGFIYAIIWMTNEIVKIDANDGKVVGKMDLTSYATDAKSTFPNAMEMNGIAYHPERKSFFITGKLWPKIYEVRF
tara:strand:+ start:603 stop:1400 length:798 start_codon:yes stop_codon:yes gene_type:complete